MLDKFDLYEICAQSPVYDSRVLAAIHGGRPRVLGEDFCGSAALSRAWVRRTRGGRAVAVDHDAPTLARAMWDGARGITFVLADVLDVRDKVDVISVQNFSICEFHQRPRLVRYLRLARSRLRRGGILACDIYSGADCFLRGTVHQVVKGPDREKITYSWEQRTADPLTGRVVNAMHFEVRKKGWATRRLDDAFVYDWRLWSVPELREAMLEAGFRATQVFPRTAGAKDQHGDYHIAPIDSPEELSDSFGAFVVGRK